MLQSALVISNTMFLRLEDKKINDMDSVYMHTRDYWITVISDFVLKVLH